MANLEKQKKLLQVQLRIKNYELRELEVFSFFYLIK